MLAKSRFAAALLCSTALVLLVALGRMPADDPARPSRVGATLTNDDCRRCHKQVWQEWETSFHSRAWSDDRVQAAFQHFGFDRRCQSCHAPRRELVMDVAAQIELRSEQLEAGVDCLSCHGLADGAVAAIRTVAAAPCRPRKVAGFSSSQACGACHEAIYNDWRESRYASEGKQCQTCHMAAVADRPGGFSHLCLGGHDDNLVRSGAKLACQQQGGELLVAVTNHATGHNYPGERHNRVLLLEVVERDAQGEVTLAQESLIKGITPFRGESSDERLRVDQTFEAHFPVVEGSKTASVRLLYKAFPWYRDRDALVVHEKQVTIGKHE